MIQEINLYRLLPKKTGMYLTREVVLTSYGILILILSTIFSLGYVQKSQLEKEYVIVNEHADMVHQQLLALTKQYPISDPIQLKQSLQDLKNQIDAKRNLIDSLTLDISFSKSLYSIAMATVPGTWLKEIILSRNNSKMTLVGFTLQRNLLEEFITGLEKQPLFSDLIFTVDEFAETSKPATFKISTKNMNL